MIQGQPNIRLLGEVDDNTLVQLYQDARAVIFPCLWSEPLGLVQLEAQACGTPVISTIIGSIPETIEHGKTGFLSNNVDEMATYIQNIDSIRPEDCRAFIEKKFSGEVMAKKYEQYCLDVIEGRTW